MTSGIYLITNTVNGKKYVGSSKKIETRWTAHRNQLRGSRHNNGRLMNAWNKYGEEAFVFEIIEEVPWENLISREIYWARKLSPEYNILQPDMNRERYIVVGHKLSDETKRKISVAHKGKKASPETRRKLSAAHTGRVHSWESRVKMAESSRGKKHTDETRLKISKTKKGNCVATPEMRRKMSIAQAGRKHSDETRKKMSESAKGRHVASPSAETRLKLSKALSGRMPWNKGVAVPDDVKEKMSKSHKGRVAWNKGKKLSPESIQRMSDAHKGKKCSEETKKKLSLANRKRP